MKAEGGGGPTRSGGRSKGRNGGRHGGGEWTAWLSVPGEMLPSDDAGDDDRRFSM